MSRQVTREQFVGTTYSELLAENAKLRDSLKALMMGTYAELCADRGEPQCKKCAMRRGSMSCVVADAMELLGIDVFGEPLGGERSSTPRLKPGA